MSHLSLHKTYSADQVEVAQFPGTRRRSGSLQCETWGIWHEVRSSVQVGRHTRAKWPRGTRYSWALSLHRTPFAHYTTHDSPTSGSTRGSGYHCHFHRLSHPSNTLQRVWVSWTLYLPPDHRPRTDIVKVSHSVMTLGSASRHLRLDNEGVQSTESISRNRRGMTGAMWCPYLQTCISGFHSNIFQKDNTFLYKSRHHMGTTGLRWWFDLLGVTNGRNRKMKLETSYSAHCLHCTTEALHPLVTWINPRHLQTPGAGDLHTLHGCQTEVSDGTLRGSLIQLSLRKAARVGSRSSCTSSSSCSPCTWRSESEPGLQSSTC